MWASTLSSRVAPHTQVATSVRSLTYHASPLAPVATVQMLDVASMNLILMTMDTYYFGADATQVFYHNEFPEVCELGAIASQLASWLALMSAVLRSHDHLAHAWVRHRTREEWRLSCSSPQSMR